MKILTNKKQDKIMKLVYNLQLAINEDDFCKSTDLLCEIAGETLSVDRLICIKEMLENKDD